MPYDYYYAKRANVALLDEQVNALVFADGRGYSGSEWLHPSITPVPGSSLVLHWERPLTSPQETEVQAVVTAHDDSQKTQDQIDQEAQAVADAAELARIQELGALARAATATPEEVRELSGLMEKRSFG